MAHGTPLDQLSIRSMERGPTLTVHLDDRQTTGYLGETVAGLLWRMGVRGSRQTNVLKEPRAYFCGMAACFECLVWVDGQPRQGCITMIQPGMKISTVQPAGKD